MGMKANLLSVVAVLMGISAGLSSGAGPAARPSPRTMEGRASVEQGDEAARPALLGGVGFPLAQEIRAPLPTLSPGELSLDDLAQRWPAFRHLPFKRAGFIHLTLPFRYEAEGKREEREALAFSFLLSNALDWAPRCYCTRHAYFTFKRSERYMRTLMQEYTQSGIDFAMKDWGATHAIGGLLRKSAEGYSGRLEIYHPGGRIPRVTEYVRPRGYFTLLGDMAVDAMRFFHYEPTLALSEHVHKPRCTDFQSILDLGAAAFAREKTWEEFGIYERILERDPGFAEVRYWYANQKQWKDRDRKAYALQTARSLKDYLTESALTSFQPRDCPDQELAAQFEEWLIRGQDLVGEGAPSLLTQRIQLHRGRLPEKLLNQATRTAAGNPNHYWFLYWLAREYEARGDAAMAASIYVAAARNQYLVAEDGKRWALAHLTRCLYSLGADSSASACARAALKIDQAAREKTRIAWDSMFVARSMARAGWYDIAVPFYRLAFHEANPSATWRREMLLEGGIAAGIARRKDVLTQILRDRRSELDETKMTPLLEAYLQVLEGKAVRPEDVEEQLPKDEGPFTAHQHMFYGQLDLLTGQSRYRKVLAQALAHQPGCRPLWILFDLYDRQDPRADSACFYEAIDWLYPDDPWVRQAVTAHRNRLPERAIPSADELLAKLADYSPVRWPQYPFGDREKAVEFLDAVPVGCAAAAIRQLLRQGELDKAEDLALRYHHAAADTRYYDVKTRANWLIRLIEEARRPLLPAAPVAPKTNADSDPL
jgi:hypothetical protein